MALISRKHNFIFIHIYKNGGNSIRRMFEAPSIGSQIKYPPGMLELHGVHVNIADVKKHFESQQDLTFYNNAFKFSVVRHPFTHLASVYRYISTSKIHQYHSTVKPMTFQQFLEWYVHIAMNMDRPYGSNKYQTQSDFLYIDGVLQMDYVCKLESIQKDMKDVFRRLHIPMVTVPMINRYDDNKRIPWQKLFDDQCKQFVIEHFKKDFELFNYPEEL